MYRKIEKQSRTNAHHAGSKSRLKKIILLVAAAFLFFSLVKNVFDYQKKMAYYREFQKEVGSEEKKNIALKTEILKSQDPFKLEKTIRDKLNLQRPGEMVFVLPQPTPTPVVVTPTPVPTWRQWWNLFFGN